MPRGRPGNGRGMTNPSEDLLTTSEGVDEGSAASTVEGATPGQPDVDPPVGADRGPSSDATPAPPVDMESDASRGSRDAAGSGQQLSAGEG